MPPPLFEIIVLTFFVKEQMIAGEVAGRAVAVSPTAPATVERADASAAAPTIVLDPAVSPDITVSTPGTYTGAAGEFGTVKIAVSGVTLDAFIFVATSDSAAISNSVAGVSDVTIRNGTFTGYTGRTITTGFAEGTGHATTRASDWEIAGNTIVQAA